MANNYIHLFVLFLYLAPCLNRDTESGVSCIVSSQGAIHVSVDCSEFGRLAPVEPEHLPVLTLPRFPLSPYPLLTLSLPLLGLDPRVRTVLLTPFPLFSSQLAFFFLSFR